MENELSALAAEYELAQVKVQSLQHQSDGGSIPVTLTCAGPLRKLVEWLETMRRDYAYVPVTKVKVQIEGPGAPARCEIFLNYRYKIVSSETQA